MNIFSQRLKELRRKKNISQKQLAKMLNFSRSTISNYEKNRRLPDVKILCEIAQFFDVTIDYLVGRSNIKNIFPQKFEYESNLITFIIDPEDASFIDCNMPALEFFGYNKDELLKMKLYHISGFSKEEVMAHIKAALEKRENVYFAQYKIANGFKDVKVTLNPFTIKNKIMLCCNIDDLTPYKTENRYLSNTILELVELISQISNKKLYFKQNHQKRTAEIAKAIGRQMKLSKEKLENLKISALLHDLGEMDLPEIINKPGNLTDEEFNLVKKHPENAYNILKDINYLKPIGKIILQHHERLDGSGYPYKLKGSQIMLEAKILAVADDLEAMTSNRSYRSALSLKSALRILEDNKNIKYDSTVVEACIEVFEKNNLFI